MRWLWFGLFELCMLACAIVSFRLRQRRKADARAQAFRWEIILLVAALVGVALMAVFRT